MVTERTPRTRLKAVPATDADASTAVLLTIPEAAERLGLSVDQVRRRRKSGALASEQRSTPFGLQWFIRLDASAEAPVIPSRRRAVADPAPVIDLQALRAEYRADVARLEVAHAGEVARAADASANAIALLRADHAEAFARLEVAHAEALNAHRETLEVLLSTHAGEVGGLRDELATANAWANRSWWRWLFGLPPG